MSPPSSPSPPVSSLSIGPRRVLRPDVPVVVADWTNAAVLETSGEIALKPVASVGQRLAAMRPIVCHLPATAARLDVDRFPAFDVLELFAFTHPARFALPTVSGLAAALGLDQAETLEDQPIALMAVLNALLAALVALPDLEARALAATAGAMARGGWMWGPAVLAALGGDPNQQKGYGPAAGLRIWSNLPEWQDRPPPPPPGSQPIE